MLIHENLTAETRPETRIVILGSNALQNELLASFLKSKTEFECCTRSCPGMGIFAPEPDEDSTRLFLVDSQSSDCDAIWKNFSGGENINDSRRLYVLYNVDKGLHIDNEAVACGIRGIFYTQEPLQDFLKGIKAILNGELWFSRKILSNFLIKQKPRHRAEPEVIADLTFREKEILMKITSGASNKEIADALCISPHTVKTHVYNTYKKIHVSNRLQATLWTAKYLQV